MWGTGVRGLGEEGSRLASSRGGATRARARSCRADPRAVKGDGRRPNAPPPLARHGRIAMQRDPRQRGSAERRLDAHAKAADRALREAGEAAVADRRPRRDTLPSAPRVGTDLEALDHLSARDGLHEAHHVASGGSTKREFGGDRGRRRCSLPRALLVVVHERRGVRAIAGHAWHPTVSRERASPGAARRRRGGARCRAHERRRRAWGGR